MPIIITADGKVSRKPKTPKARKPRVSHAKEKRVFPTYRKEWSTMDYIYAYHAANATVNLTMVEYQCH